MQNVKFSLKDKKRLIVLHNEIQRRVLQVQFGKENEGHNARLRGECEVLTDAIKAINDKYAERATA